MRLLIELFVVSNMILILILLNVRGSTDSSTTTKLQNMVFDKNPGFSQRVGKLDMAGQLASLKAGFLRTGDVYFQPMGYMFAEKCMVDTSLSIRWGHHILHITFTHTHEHTRSYYIVCYLSFLVALVA